MKYNKKNIGERIRECRKAYRDDRDYRDHAPDQAGFGALLIEDSEKEVHPNTISSWENGKTLPELKYLLRMCDLFDCELGYLLCEFDTKTRAATDIQKETGLSEKAITILKKEHLFGSRTRLLNLFILNCEPIVTSISEIEKNLLRKANLRVGTPEIEKQMQEIFDQIYDGNYPEYEKPLLFIESVMEQIEYGWTKEGMYTNAKELFDHPAGQKERYYREYQRLVEDREHHGIKYHRYNISLLFEQIIDALISPRIMKISDDGVDEINLNERNNEDGKHEKK